MKQEIPEDEDFKDKLRKVRAWEDLHEMDVRKAIKESKGPFTARGKYINYHEHHATEAGISLIGLSFIMSEHGAPGLGGAFTYFYIFLGYKVLKDCHRECENPVKLVGELGKNFHYYLAAGFLTALFFIKLGYKPPEMSLGLAANIATIFGV